MLEAVRRFLDERGDLGCAPLLAMLVEQICGLDPEVEAEATAFGIRFHYRGALLVEISVFGALFIVRVGREQAIEYRVRGRTVALEALNRILEEYGELLQAPARQVGGEAPGTPVHSPPA